MKKYKRILFPTDFSEASENALKYTVKLADKLGAELDLISIYQVSAGLSDSMPPEMIEVIIEDKKKQTEKKMVSLVNNYCKNRETKQRVIYGIFPAEEIAQYADSEDYDLIVMGTKGERAVLEKMLGSVTTETMLKASCPVLAIPAHAEFKGIDSVAFATDYEHKDGDAILFTTDFALQVGAEMHIVHVETQKGKSKPAGTMTDYLAYTLVEDKSIEEGLDTYIKERKADVLAMFIPKRRLWERLFHSSFTKQMTFHSKTPLLVFRGVQKEA